jgi:hypothetical protein
MFVFLANKTVSSVKALINVYNAMNSLYYLKEAVWINVLKECLINKELVVDVTQIVKHAHLQLIHV